MASMDYRYRAGFCTKFRWFVPIMMHGQQNVILIYNDARSTERYCDI
jgi:hypothetical protein